MAQAWEYDGIDLTRYGYNVRLLGAPFRVPARRGENVVIPHKTGRLHVVKWMDENVQSLAMWVRDIPAAGGSSSEANMLANLDALRGLFARSGQHTLKGQFGTVTRTALAEVVNQIDFEPQGRTNVYAFVVEFVIAGGLWLAESKTTVGPTTISMVNQNITVTNAGTYKSEKAIFTLAGPLSNPKLTIGSVWVQYTGAIAGGQSLVIDCGAWTALLAGADVSGNITHDGDLCWLPIPAGANTLAVTTGTTGGTVKVEFYPPYI